MREDTIMPQTVSVNEEFKAAWIAPIVSKVQAGDAENGANTGNEFDGTAS